MRYINLMLALSLLSSPIFDETIEEDPVEELTNSEIIEEEGSEEDPPPQFEDSVVVIANEDEDDETVGIGEDENNILELYLIEAHVPFWNGKTYVTNNTVINRTIENEIEVIDSKVYIPSHYFEEIFGEYGYSSEYDTLTYLDGSKFKNVVPNEDGYIVIPESNKGVFYYTTPIVKTDILSPSSTVINMFDYWTTANRLDSDNHVTSRAELNTGINANHQLKFLKNDNKLNVGLINYSYGGTSTKSKLTQGIVNKILGEDGYPCLSGDELLGMTNEESLSYLFNPNEESQGKMSFKNTKNLLTTTSDGYFYYNSLENYAQLNENTNIFTLYENPAGKNTSISGYSYGQFYPYNEFNSVNMLTSTMDPINHYFGMSMITRFYQNYDGYTTSNKNQEMTFEFSGDNDVWIFIDGVLVADMGGLSSARNLSMNFHTGEVSIIDYDTNPTQTLRDAFRAAGMEDSVSWNGETFANGSSHVLKFFYLERGNYDSNLKLKFNLSEIPPTNIYKVSQYGDAVEGAEFSVYKADDDWNIISDIVYVGTTNVNGEMTFVDDEGLPLPMGEIRNLFGDKFIIRETGVPEGYRTVSDDICMYIEGGLLQVADVYGTGTWSNPNAMINASNILYVAPDSYKTANSIPEINDDYTIEYADIENNSSNGLLFSVVLKRNGADADNDTLDNLHFDTWTPLYGNDEDGYFEMNENYSHIDNVIEAAKIQQDDYQNVCFYNSTTGMQLMLEDIPDYPYRYYTYMVENRDLVTTSTTDPQYLVAYYWTSADSLDEATAFNTVRIASHENTTPESDVGFLVQWGSTIKVPNIENRLYIQKVNEVGDYLSGATFAIYPVTEENGIVYYYSSDGSLVNLNDVEYKLQNDGTIIFNEDKLILPLETQITNENGELHFSKLKTGWYVVREAAPPFGYIPNQSEVKVIVDENAVYANAGEENDGIVVGNGLGYLVKTLTVFASEGSINETLTWMAEVLKVRIDDTFASFQNTNEWRYYAANDHSESTFAGVSSTLTESLNDAMITYLIYDPDSESSLYNYYANPDQSERELTLADNSVQSFQEGEGTLRLYTDEGWSSLVAYQDYAYGFEESNVKDNTSYDDLRLVDLSNIFSYSTYIRFENEVSPDAEQFILPETGGSGVKKIYKTELMLIGIILVMFLYRRGKE